MLSSCLLCMHSLALLFLLGLPLFPSIFPAPTICGTMYLSLNKAEIHAPTCLPRSNTYHLIPYHSAHAHTHTYAWMHTCMHTHTHMPTHAHAHAHAHAHTHTHTHTHTLTHTHSLTHSLTHTLTLTQRPIVPWHTNQTISASVLLFKGRRLSIAVP